jgi:hypothetical protein
MEEGGYRTEQKRECIDIFGNQDSPWKKEYKHGMGEGEEYNWRNQYKLKFPYRSLFSRYVHCKIVKQ